MGKLDKGRGTIKERKAGPKRDPPVKKNYGKKEIWAYISYVLQGSLLLYFIGFLFYGKIYLRLFLLLLLPFFIKFKKRRAEEKRDERLRGQIIEALRSLSASMFVGYSLENAWKEVYKEMLILYGEKGEICVELKGLLIRQRMNEPTEKILKDMAFRLGNEDLMLFSGIIEYAKRSGGSFNKIIGSTVNQMAEKAEIDREIGTLITAKKTEQTIMCLVPMGILAYLRVASPGYLDVMYETPMGIAVMTGCLIAYGFAFLEGMKITEIRV